jgi:predicted ATP-dependent protease
MRQWRLFAGRCAEAATGNLGWPSLKRALNAGEIRIESLEQLLSMASTVSLAPEPIPLKIKIVLIGPPLIYYLLSANDDEFPDLFKIAADFEDRVERTPDSTLLYARLICAVSRREELRPFDRDAVARHRTAARLAGDADRLWTGMRVSPISCRKPTSWPRTAAEVVGAAEVQAAIDAQFRRGDRSIGVCRKKSGARQSASRLMALR